MTTDTETKRYNGWTNYETWLVALWMDNEEGSQRYWSEMAQTSYDDTAPESYQTRKESAAYDLSQMLKEEHEEAMPEVAGMWADLLNAAMSEVNWYEIAEHLVSDVDEEESDEEDES